VRSDAAALPFHGAAFGGAAADERGIQRIRRTPHLAFSCLRHCGLTPW
jgi:hypothetical protein